MDTTGEEDQIVLEQTLSEVDKLFALIKSLPDIYRATVLQKLKQELSRYETGANNNSKCFHGTENKSDVVKVRVSSRPKKLTAKAQILFDESQSQASGMYKKWSGSNKTVKSLITDTVRPCFVRLEPLKGSPGTLHVKQKVVASSVMDTSEQELSKQIVCSDGDWDENIDDPLCTNNTKRRFLSKNIRKNWKTPNVQENEKTFKCLRCDKSFSQKSGLDIHMKRHNGIKHFSCALCEYKAVCKIEILRHMSKHTGERNYSCKICCKTFTSDGGLRNHMKNVHVRSEKCFCSECSFQTHSKDILKRHYLIKHTKREEFECPVCHEVIKQKGTFMIHMRKHTGERPYQCVLCIKTFKSSSQLAAHTRTHRPGEYTCSVCNKRFKARHQLVRHKIIHTGEKPYLCHLCNYACNVRANITKHIRSVHKLHAFSFKKPYSRNTMPNGNPGAVERGKKAADKYLQEHTLKARENISLEDLKNPSKNKQENLSKSNVNETRSTSALSVVPLTDACSSSNIKVFEECANVNPCVTSSGSSTFLDSCTSDTLSNAVQLLNPSDLSLEDYDVQYKSPNETTTIPVEIGPNMYVIQVVSEQKILL